MIRAILSLALLLLAAVRQEPSGRWLAVVKIGRQYGGSRSFQTRREAIAWETRRKAELSGGLDPAAGRVVLARSIQDWLEDRRGVVAEKTLRADQDLLRLLPAWFLGLRVDRVTDAAVDRLLNDLAKSVGHATLTRLRASLSSYFSSCVRRKIVPSNPVSVVRLPNRQDEAHEMRPLTELEVEEVAREIAGHSEWCATVVILLSWLGLRWGEFRAVRVEDFVESPTPAVFVRRSHSEGYAEKTTKGRRSRRVPVADRVLPLVQAMAQGKAPHELLFTTPSGGQLHQGTFKRAARWSVTGRGRRLHDLRHTAACLWLARGVDLSTVQAWMGHQDARTTNLYLHHLGSAADRAALTLLNSPGASQGQVTGKEGTPQTASESR